MRIALLFLAACGPFRVYEGPRMEPSEVAHVTIEGGLISKKERFDAELIEFDGVNPRRKHTEFEILPGEHTLTIRWIHYILENEEATGVLPMTFELRAGYRYTLFWVGGDSPLRFRERPYQ